MLTSGSFAILTLVVAALAKSVMFVIVALFLWFLAWNRWMEYKRVKGWLSRPVPTNEQERVIWARIFYSEMSHPPIWLKSSNWIAAVMAVVVVLAVSIEVVALSGPWTRLLYGLAYGIAGAAVSFWALTQRRYAREMRERLRLTGEMWGDLT
jgi:ABC-type multidrug transport system permease subunit